MMTIATVGCFLMHSRAIGEDILRQTFAKAVQRIRFFVTQIVTAARSMVHLWKVIKVCVNSSSFQYSPCSC